MIEVRIKKGFGKFSIDVDFSSDSSGITVLAGPSGSGKTSIINMISGLVTPDEGRIFIKNRLLFDSERGLNIPVSRRGCGYIFQDGRLFPHMSVRSNLLYGRESDESMLEEIVTLLGIGHLLDRMPGRLSGGEKQRVAIGRALMMKPKILLMDEPLASLDPSRREELLEYIARLPEQFDIPVFYVTHSVREMVRLSDRLIKIADGRIESSGKPEGEYYAPGMTDTENNLVSLFNCSVESYDSELGVITALFNGGNIYILSDRAPEEKSLRIAIKASDISVALTRPENISSRNIFEGIIEKIEDTGGHSAYVHCDIGSPVAARISRASIQRLGLEPGMRVYLLVKVVSMIY